MDYSARMLGGTSGVISCSIHNAYDICLQKNFCRVWGNCYRPLHVFVSLSVPIKVIFILSTLERGFVSFPFAATVARLSVPVLPWLHLLAFCHLGSWGILGNGVKSLSLGPPYGQWENHNMTTQTHRSNQQKITDSARFKHAWCTDQSHGCFVDGWQRKVSAFHLPHLHRLQPNVRFCRLVHAVIWAWFR